MERLGLGSWFDRLTINPFTIKHHVKIRYSFYAICIVILIISGTGCESKTPHQRAQEQIQQLNDTLRKLDIEVKKAQNTLCQYGFECTI